MPRVLRSELGELVLILIGSVVGAALFGWAAVNTVVESSGDWNERTVIESGRGAGASSTVTGYVYLYVVLAIGCIVSIFFCVVALRSERTQSRPRARRSEAPRGRRARR